MTFHLAERFLSINGEGQEAGKLAVFLRFPHCNLQCSYCDTTWANAPDCPTQSLSLQDICDYVLESQVSQVTVTGGEPLLQENIGALLQVLSLLEGVSVEVETNGSVPLAPFLSHAPKVSYTMDYKLPSSGMEDKMYLENLPRLRQRDSLKFVVGSKADLQRAYHLIQTHHLDSQTQVFFSPVFGNIEPKTIVEFLKTKHLRHVKLQLQLHKFIWHPEEKGV